MSGSLHVLCVDDDPDSGSTAAEFLGRELSHADVSAADGATEALAILDDRPVDCVVSDYELPDENGLELLRTIRETDPDLPFILFTGKGSEEIASEAISAGVTDYLQKGGTEQYALLTNRIENAVAQYRSERDLRQVRRKFEHLHDTALELRETDDRERAVDCAVETAREVLAFDTCAVFEMRDGEFVPVASENYPEDAGRYAVDEGFVGETFRLGESRLVEDIRETDVARPADESFRSGLSVPVGDHGVFQAISTTVGEFDERDRELAELLVSHLVGALDRIEYQRDLERTNEQLETLLENTTAHIYIKDREGRYTLVNDRFADRLGYDREEIIGRTDEELQDGEIAQSVRRNDRRAIETGRTIEVEEAADWNGDQRVYYSIKAPLFGDDGEPRGVCGVSSDITELKARERELERKTERLDEFASLVSHDLRNPLNVASGQLELLEREDRSDPETVERLDRALTRMEDIIDGVLELARSGRTIGETAPVDLERASRVAWRTVETGDAELQVDCDRTVVADADRVRQLFENLFRNAVEHGSSPASHAQQDAVEHGDPDVTVVVEDTADGFAVADDGPGLPEDVSDDVFSPGFSTDPGGTGLGLSIVSRIAEAHGWEVSTVDSGGGARFEFEV